VDTGLAGADRRVLGWSDGKSWAYEKSSINENKKGKLGVKLICFLGGWGSETIRAREGGPRLRGKRTGEPKKGVMQIPFNVHQGEEAANTFVRTGPCKEEG